MAVKSKKKGDKGRSDFTSAVSGKKIGKKLSWKLMAALGVPVILIGGYFAVAAGSKPPQGNNLYGICRAFIEQNTLFPETVKIIEFDQTIPDGEDPSAPQRISYQISFSAVDGFGQYLLNTLTCEFRFKTDLVNTPWQGIVLERTFMNGRQEMKDSQGKGLGYPVHGWVDTYYPPDKKDPRPSDDFSERLEIFHNGVPSLLANPPDLTLPRYDLKRLPINRYQEL